LSLVVSAAAMASGFFGRFWEKLLR